MEIKSLELQNFMSYKSQSFDEISDPELTLISGPNGGGKSTLWDSISWCFFGSTVRGVKNDAVINRKLKKDCSVICNVVVKGEPIRVRRYRKHTAFGDKLMFERKGKIVELGSVADTQEQLLKLLGIDFDLFKCSILFGQGETFNFVNAGNKAQKDILSKVMRINYSEQLDKAKSLFREKQDKKIGIESKMASLQTFLEEEAEDYDAQIKQWDADQREALKAELAGIKELQSKFDLVGLGVSDLDAVKEKRSKLLSLQEKTQEQYDKYNESLIKSKAIFGQHKDAVEQLESLGAECPTCAQDIGEEHKSTAVNGCQQKMKDQQMIIHQVQGKMEPLKKSIARIDTEVEKLDEQIDEAKDAAREKASLERQIETAKKKLIETKAEVNPYKNMKEKAEKKRAEVAEKIKSFQTELAGLDADLPYYEFWVSAFGDAGIKSFIFDLICASLTNKANKYLNILTSGEVTISFDTQKKTKSGELREKFDCEILVGGERVEYESYSGGEKRRISLAVDMALSEIMSEYYGQKFGMVVFDEQTSYMDNGGRVGFMNLLKEIAREKRVFVIDHDNEFKAMFDEVWSVAKVGGFSQVTH